MDFNTKKDWDDLDCMASLLQVDCEKARYMSNGLFQFTDYDITQRDGISFLLHYYKDMCLAVSILHDIILGINDQMKELASAIAALEPKAIPKPQEQTA